MPAEALWAAGHLVTVRLPSADATTSTTVGEATTTGATAEVPAKDPSPLTIAPKELLWSLGSFLVLLALMRLVFYPRLHAGVEARQNHIAGNLAEAQAAKDAANAEVAEYEAALAAVRSDAQARIDAASRTVEAERSAKMAEVTASIAERRVAANLEIDAAKAAVAGGVAEAARDVVRAAVTHVLDRSPDPGALEGAVDRAMGAGVRR